MQAFIPCPSEIRSVQPGGWLTWVSLVSLLALLAGCASQPRNPSALKDWVSPEMAKLLDEQARAARGESADLDGDGQRETTAIHRADGTRRWESDHNQDGRPEGVIDELPNGDWVQCIDSDNDGRFELKQEYLGETTLLSWRDTNGNGSYDERRIEVTTEHGIEVRVETDPREDGHFVLKESFVLQEPIR